MTGCHICGFAKAEQLPQTGAPFRLVSSDVQPAAGAAEFSFCPNCLAIQKVVSPAWHAMAQRIYANYNINHQSHGAEPMVFDSAKGSGPRSQIMLRNVLDVVPLPAEGRLLDIGCSNGNLLKSFNALRPAWRLSGAELEDTWKSAILALPGVEQFYSGPQSAYRGTFDVISLSHVLEHVADPIPFLKTISGYLSEGGRILLVSPNVTQNPIDLVIADHCTHFDERSLVYVIEAAGLGVDLLSADLLPKEFVAIIRARAGEAARGQAGAQAGASRARCQYCFKLLEDVRAAARSAAVERHPFGIMGSSIAACWTMLELDGKVDFFIDEDPDRVGHELAGLPILSPSQAPRGALVFIPMSAPVAEKIIERSRHLPLEFRFVPWNRPM